MKINAYEKVYGEPLTIKDLIKGFNNNSATGAVTSMDGKLNIRPPYQREFVYGDARRNAVIYTILDRCPLSAMYFVKNDDGTLEVLDGQQRITSICKYAHNEYCVSLSTGCAATDVAEMNYNNLSDIEKDAFDNHELQVYVCEGSSEERLAWFRKINFVGVALTEQELRNANFVGSWLLDAKKYFSRQNCLGISTQLDGGRVCDDYIDAKGGATSDDAKAIVRQYLLEKVLKWAYDKDNANRTAKAKDAKFDVDSYMSAHYHDRDARELWRYYEDVMWWVSRTFPTYNKAMKSVEWGLLYNRYKDVPADDLDDMVVSIIDGDEIVNIKCVYEAVLSGDYTILNPRSFSEQDKKRKLREQGNKCAYCGGMIDLSNAAGDHIVPWSKGGKTEYSNLQMLCVRCNCKKSNHDEAVDPFDGKFYVYDSDTTND